jgi:hypothetical protein
LKPLELQGIQGVSFIQTLKGITVNLVLKI